MDWRGVFGGVVLCIWVRCVLVQWLGRTMVLGVGERRAGKHHQQQRGGKQLLHGINLAFGVASLAAIRRPRTKKETGVLWKRAHLLHPVTAGFI